MASMRALFLLLASYHINQSLSASCNCASLSKHECGTNSACQFRSSIPDGKCRAIQWFDCEMNHECSDNRNEITGEEDVDWPYDCMDEDDDSLFSMFSSTEMTETCADHGLIQNTTCQCIVNDAAVCYDAQNGDCEDGPDVYCPNGGVCCCGECSNQP